MRRIKIVLRILNPQIRKNRIIVEQKSGVCANGNKRRTFLRFQTEMLSNKRQD